MEFFLLINVEMPTINGIFNLYGQENSILGLSESKNASAALGSSILYG